MPSLRQLQHRIEVDILDASVDAERRAQAAVRNQKGRVGGVAELDNQGKLPDAQIPDGITRDSELSVFALSTHRHAAAASWPIGSIFFGSTATDPALLLGNGTWNLLGTGILTIGLATPTVWAWERTA